MGIGRGWLGAVIAWQAAGAQRAVRIDCGLSSTVK